eukprot:CAMPEP_0206247986 /NCGR_PEP_ID=MMETSP0047_2-20121206/20113_1 /ASSEMBLY_ACC=CAM_ASM_000192 /TAXON_ID=195065 /ORGANISM="Chroomonas mesostigmatica_cf, Strain CCMP1168" /LENGTH=778 /DNA_ID=CAMNT_0053673569 /DNA_START=380 /DNA_END=2716 /DNA_ORIENTATION=+
MSAPLPLADKSAVPLNEDGFVTLRLRMNYGLDRGVVSASGPGTYFGGNDVKKAVQFKRKGGDDWEAEVKVPISAGVVYYHYVIQSTTWRYEARICDRSVSVKGMKDGDIIDVSDSFRSAKPATLATSCFSKAIFGRGHQDQNTKTENTVAGMDEIVWPEVGPKQVCVRASVYAPRVEAGHSVWMRGKPDAMGAWSHESRVPMVHLGNRIYVGQVVVDVSDMPLEYKLTIYDANDKEVCSEKDVHKVSAMGGAKHVVTDHSFNYPNPQFKTAGVAIPVSGIKTRESTGIGEFLDLKKMVDWCVKTGLQVIQILPINDSGEDPSPYSASSSFALHPTNVRCKTVAEYYSTKYGLDMSGQLGWAQSLIDKLNPNWKIDYPKILDEKKRLMDAIFDAVGQEKVWKDEEFQAWLQHQESWVKTYAAFKVQLNKEKGFNNKWWDTSTWRVRVSETQGITNEHSPDFGQVVRVYFTQYHLHRQLKEASLYAEQNGIAIKGDIPIGVTRCSADVWAEPNLFKLHKNAGAPGDPEQNWGFPPYNWDEMHRDDCSWWKRRLKHMEQYFHAYRIDHVLGFFRMWEIPQNGGGGSYYPQGGLREAGLRNLRAVQTASNMLICGEDLGNVPDEVPPVLLELGVLGLRIQRWCDGQTWKYPLLTVAASSCHDCSPCRLWWNEEWGGAEGWYNFFVGKGTCPGGPPDWISQKIIKMHCESSSLLTVNPIQDYVDCWEKLRSKNPKNDMINRPGSTDGVWLYRCHLFMEDLLKEESFNDWLQKTTKETGRGVAY